jgi:hypothetical protein
MILVSASTAALTMASPVCDYARRSLEQRDEAGPGDLNQTGGLHPRLGPVSTGELAAVQIFSTTLRER